MLQKIRNTLGPILLIICCPPIVMLMWYTNTHLHGSLQLLWQMFQINGVWQTVFKIWSPVFFGNITAWTIIISFILFEVLLIKSLPGKLFQGPETAKGNIPIYKANGELAFIVTIAVYCFATFYLHLFSASIIYDNFGAILGALNIFSLIFCLFLYLKGRYKPSSTDSGHSGNFIFDYYWGTELYPTFAGINLKMFINCRIGMMSWALIVISCAAKQYYFFGISNSMLVSAALQLFYIAKFFYWETGYLHSLDIMHDRAGFYICWGCLVWVPGIYASPAMYLVANPINLNPNLALSILGFGVAAILINVMADRQRQVVRATNGNCRVWFKEPRIIKTKYISEKGEVKQSILLTSGWWGVARHFHYLPEIMGAFFWTVPALFINATPYFYVAFLTVLLVDRAFRDDKRCADKYGEYWEIYCNQVPYKILPFLI